MGASHMTMLQLRGPIGSCVLPWWLFIAVDTLYQHPMGTDHMTVLQLCGLMEFRVLQWCHPMLASTRRRTSCCTRIITLYGTRKWIQACTETQDRCHQSVAPQNVPQNVSPKTEVSVPPPPHQKQIVKKRILTLQMLLPYS